MHFPAIWMPVRPQSMDQPIAGGCLKMLGLGVPVPSPHGGCARVSLLVLDLNNS